MWFAVHTAVRWYCRVGWPCVFCILMLHTPPEINMPFISVFSDLTGSMLNIKTRCALENDLQKGLNVTDVTSSHDFVRRWHVRSVSVRLVGVFLLKLPCYRRVHKLALWPQRHRLIGPASSSAFAQPPCARSFCGVWIGALSCQSENTITNVCVREYALNVCVGCDSQTPKLRRKKKNSIHRQKRNSPTHLTYWLRVM